MSNPFELMHTIEQTQCVSCRFRKSPLEDKQHAIDYPMCYEIEAALCLEEDEAEGLDEDEFGMVVCVKYRLGDPDETFGVHPDQLSLGEL